MTRRKLQGSVRWQAGAGRDICFHPLVPVCTIAEERRRELCSQVPAWGTATGFECHKIKKNVTVNGVCYFDKDFTRKTVIGLLDIYGFEVFDKNG